jgi:hypothetical protein
LPELQSDIAPDVAAFGDEESSPFGVEKMEKESAAGMSPSASKALLAAVAAGAAGFPAYYAYRASKDIGSKEKLRMTEDEIRELRRAYDAMFKKQVLEDLGTSPEALQEQLSLAKVSASGGPYKWALKNAPLLAGTVVGGGLAVGGFEKGLKDALSSSDRRRAQKKYLALLNKLNRARNAQVQLVDIAFTPEEMTMLEQLRKDTGKVTRKKPKLVSLPEQKEAPPATVPADSENPELKTLLSSI